MKVQKDVNFSANLKSIETWMYCTNGRYRISTMPSTCSAASLRKALAEIEEFIQACEEGVE